MPKGRLRYLDEGDVVTAAAAAVAVAAVIVNCDDGDVGKDVR